MINVLHWGLTHNPGGIETVTLKILKKIDRDKIRFDFFIYDDVLAYENKFKEYGCHVFKMTNANHNPIKRFFKTYIFFKKNKKNIDVFHCSLCNLYSIMPIVFAKFFGIKKIIVHSRQGDYLNRSFFNVLRHEINKRLVCFFATDYLACSKIAAKFMFPSWIYENERYEVVYNPFDYDAYCFCEKKRDEIRKKFCCENAFVVGHVGVFLPFKNHKFVIEVFSEIKKMRKNAKLMLIGDGPQKNVDEIVTFIKCKKLEHDVFMLGSVEDIQGCMSSMDVFLFPSKNEGFPNVVIEAQSSGLTCFLSENITNEVSILHSNVNFLSLQESSIVWAENILAKTKNNFIRKVPVEKFYNIDINHIVKKYQKIYLR